MNCFEKDLTSLDKLAEKTASWCCQFLKSIDGKPVAQIDDPQPPGVDLADRGVGAMAALEHFQRDLAPGLSASAGPRYLGFVTGGTTPAAMVADWLVSATDQNVALPGDSISSAVELQSLDWLRQLFQLPEIFEGVLTTGGTASNILGVLCGRQFAGLSQGMDIARNGLKGAEIEVYAATPHASTQKAFAITGLGRDSMIPVNCLDNSEAMDISHLEQLLGESNVPGKIVIASAGTVTGTAFDDLKATAALCRKHKAWLHVDGAFGLFSRLSEGRLHWTEGVELADSITCDGHKWLNLPYDCGIFYTRHPEILQQSCSVAAPYLEVGGNSISLMDRGIENSRRFRALPVWMSLKAYGREGFSELVERNCAQAKQLASWIELSDDYQLLTPCNLNVVLFRPRADQADVRDQLKAINSSGKVFMTPGFWQGKSAIRAAFSNWRTSDEDVQTICEILASTALQ